MRRQASRRLMIPDLHCKAVVHQGQHSRAPSPSLQLVFQTLSVQLQTALIHADEHISFPANPILPHSLFLRFIACLPSHGAPISSCTPSILLKCQHEGGAATPAVHRVVKQVCCLLSSTGGARTLSNCADISLVTICSSPWEIAKTGT